MMNRINYEKVQESINVLVKTVDTEAIKAAARDGFDETDVLALGAWFQLKPVLNSYGDMLEELDHMADEINKINRKIERMDDLYKSINTTMQNMDKTLNKMWAWMQKEYEAD